MEPLEKKIEDYAEIIGKIAGDSPVGIDAKFTHAVIIDYLQRIEKRLAKIEEAMR